MYVSMHLFEARYAVETLDSLLFRNEARPTKIWERDTD